VKIKDHLRGFVDFNRQRDRPDFTLSSAQPHERRFERGPGFPEVSSSNRRVASVDFGKQKGRNDADFMV
jgi:hypothetical protein